MQVRWIKCKMELPTKKPLRKERFLCFVPKANSFLVKRIGLIENIPDSELKRPGC